ncbi:MAG TPA: IPT/TIG domain-containing protein [Polyangiaceae bacterium]|nr:IPT/TIG domain-containing protein [Polyangiaceae bacterium]
MRFRLQTALVILVGASLLGGCRASGKASLPRIEDDGSDLPPTLDAGTTRPDEEPEALPHALLGIEPPHGPFSGGTLVLLRGNGFAGNTRVWFGENEIPSEQVLSVDSHRLQVTAPAGEAGPVDVAVQNGDDVSTRVVLRGGFSYDAFYVEPSTGPTAGGTLVTLHGQGTSWDSDTQIQIDDQPCELVELLSPSELTCRAPAGSPGAKPVSVTSGEERIDVLDGFAYTNSDNGFRGGFTGSPLRDELTVLVFDSIQGEALPGASVIVGVDDPEVERTDRDGVAVVQQRELGPKQTITVVRRCFQPVTFVDVPVDRLTVYLDPVLSPACFDPKGDLEAPGGTPSDTAVVSGGLVWPLDGEFRRHDWGNVPAPKTDSEMLAAYVFALASRPTDAFSLPSAVGTITPDTNEISGASFSLFTRPGTYTLYALAGVENRRRQPFTFTPYAMGLVRGVPALSSGQTADVYIEVNVGLDHALRIDVAGPKPTRRGPDRVEGNLALQVGTEGYVLLPGGQKSALLSAGSTLEFVGIPPLSKGLAAANYVVSLRAVTGDAGTLPESVLARVVTRDTSEVLDPGAFLEIPVLTEPEPNGEWSGRELAFTHVAGGPSADLALVDLTSNSDLYHWQIVAPGNVRRVRLPDLGAISTDIAWPSGQQLVTLTLARLPNFDYASLRYRDLTDRAWAAYARDAFFLDHASSSDY